MEKYYWFVSQHTVIAVTVAAVIAFVAGIRVWKSKRGMRINGIAVHGPGAQVGFEIEVFRVGAVLAALILISFAVADELTSHITTNSAVPVQGRITDITGAGVAGAVVRITNMQSEISWQTTTDTAGTYKFPSLEPGTYKVEITANGFKSYERQPVNVAALSLTFPLKPAQ